MISSALVLLVLSQGITGELPVLELMSGIVANARNDAARAGGDTSGTQGIYLASFLALARTATGRDVSADDVSSVAGASFENTTPAEAPRCRAARVSARPTCSMRFGLYVELNGAFVTPVEAEAIVTTKWITNRTGTLTLRTLRMRFVRRNDAWLMTEQEVLMQS